MANFSALKTAIQNAIRQNGNEEITGDVLQQILLSVVNTMGDGAINTIEQNLSNETLARQGADNTLQSHIDAEALARGNADTQLQNAINAIKANIDNGYVYAGIATPSSTPVSGKVFYIATAAGTYTNFGGQVLTQGINILRFNGSAWSSQQLIGIDDVPTAGSNGLAKSGGVYGKLDSKILSESVNTLNGLVSGVGKYVYISNSNYRQSVIKINGGDIIKVCGPIMTKDTVISFLQSLDNILVNNGTVDFSTEEGFDRRIVVQKSDTLTITAPSDANYLCVQILSNSVVCEPGFISINNESYLKLSEIYKNKFAAERCVPVLLKEYMLGFVSPNGTVAYKTEDNRQVVFAVKSGDSIKVKGNAVNEVLLTFAKAVRFESNDILISSETSFNERKVIAQNQEFQFTVPSDANYVVLSTLINNIDRAPSNFSINGYEFFNEQNINDLFDTRKHERESYTGIGMLTPEVINPTTLPISIYTIISVQSGDYVELNGTFKRSDSVFAFVRSFPSMKNGSFKVDYSSYEGFTERLTITKGQYKAFEAPEDVKYIILMKQIANENSLPDIKINNEAFKTNRGDYDLQKYVERYGMLASSPNWYNNNSYRFIEVPVSPNDEVLIVQGHGHDTIIGFLTEKSDFNPSGVVPYSQVEGFTSRIVISPGEVRSFIVPADTRYLILQSNLQDRNALPFIMYINGVEIAYSEKYALQQHTREVLQNMCCVSDTINHRAASAPMSVINNNGIVFSDYLAGYMSKPEHYGEQGDAIVLSVFPILQPSRVEYYTVAEDGETIDGVYMRIPYEPNITLIEGGVRCFFRVDQKYYYRDFDYTTKQFGHLHEMMMNNVQVSFDSVKAYLQSQGKDISPMLPSLTFTAQIIEHNEYKWGMLQAREAYPLVVRSADDFATAEPVAICPHLNMWESGIGFIDDTFYMTMRYTSGKFMYKTSDWQNWEGLYIDANKVALQKSTMLMHNNAIYIFYSLWEAESQNYVWGGRNNIKIVRYDGNIFTDIDFLEDPYGIVYPNVLNWNGLLYLLFSNSYLFKNQDPGSDAQRRPQGKDCVWFARLYELL